MGLDHNIIRCVICGVMLSCNRGKGEGGKGMCTRISYTAGPYTNSYSCLAEMRKKVSGKPILGQEGNPTHKLYPEQKRTVLNILCIYLGQSTTVT